MASTFAERYRKLLAFKSRDVEEPIDMLFHRPVAAAFTATIFGFPLKPNHITYMSLVAGLAGSVSLYLVAFTDIVGPWAYTAAGLLFFASVILDCADGQLARARGGGTRMGRILDGMVDLLVLTPAYTLMVLDIANRHGFEWFWIGAFAGASTGLQIWIYDKIKTMYLARTAPSAGDGNETVEEVEAEYEEARVSGKVFEVIGLWTYLLLLRGQNLFAGDDGTGNVDVYDPDAVEDFRAQHRGTMRTASYLGLGTHMIVIYTAVIAMTFWPWATAVIQVLFATIFNVIFVVSLVRSRSF